MKVRLNKSEFFIAVQHGVMRQMQNLKNKLKDAYGAEMMDGWGVHIEGACAETVLAKTMGVFYNGNMGDLDATDVNLENSKIECRSTSHLTGRLILHEEDSDDAFFFLLVGKAPEFEIKGWIKGVDGKKKAYWSDPTKKGRHAFFVPQSALNRFVSKEEFYEKNSTMIGA
jgi:hypothetical protein